MLGLGEGWMFAAYGLCIITAVICAVCGVVTWTRGADEEAKASHDTRELMNQ